MMSYFLKLFNVNFTLAESAKVGQGRGRVRQVRIRADRVLRGGVRSGQIVKTTIPSYFASVV